MIDAEDLIALVRNYNPKTNTEMIARAYEYGRKLHEALAGPTELAIIAGTGHNDVDNSSEYDRVVMGFLRTLER